MDKIIIGIIAEISAGKTTATEYLKEKYGAVSFRFSDSLKDILTRLNLAITRQNYQILSTTLRQNFSEDILSKVMAEDVKKSDKQIIITEGVRRPSDIVYLKELPGFHLVSIEVNEKTRFERTTNRQEKIDDQAKTWEEFVKDGQQEPEQQIRALMQQAEVHINNNGTLEELYQQLDEMVEKYLNK